MSDKEMSEKEKNVNSANEWLEKRFNLRDILSWSTLGGLVYGEIDKRLEIKDAVKQALGKPIPKHVNWFFCFGGITFFLFIVALVTGVLLAFYYQPVPEFAYQSILHIMNEVKFGWLIRSFHRWAAECMIFMIFLHFLRVYFMGAYKPPREMNWVVGIFLFCITLCFIFTGNLLPWDQKAYWTTKLGVDVVEELPVVGHVLALFIKGSVQIGAMTLTRFFSLHTIVLPAFIILFLILHFIMVRRLGISEPL